MSETIPCLSLWQPWASLWFNAKIHETRDWPLRYRGWLAVHATKKIVHDVTARLSDICDGEFGNHWGMDLPRGAIIGVVNVVACKPAGLAHQQYMQGAAGWTEDQLDDYECGNFLPGRFAFERKEAVLLAQPIPYRGQQSLFRIPRDLVREALPRMTRDTHDMFRERDRGRFGDNETVRGNDSVRSDLVDLDLILHNDNPAKKAIAVSLRGDTPFAQWVWLPRSLIEYEKTGIGVNGSALVRVTLPERLAKEKGLV